MHKVDGLLSRNISEKLDKLILQAIKKADKELGDKIKSLLNKGRNHQVGQIIQKRMRLDQTGKYNYIILDHKPIMVYSETKTELDRAGNSMTASIQYQLLPMEEETHE